MQDNIYGLFHKRSHRPGTAPGTLDETPVAEAVPATIRLIHYSGTVYEEKELASVLDSQAYLGKRAVTWIHIQGHPRPELLREIGQLIDLHSLAMEDIMNLGQRPKIEEYEDQLFITLNLPEQHREETTIVQLSLIVDEHCLISFCPAMTDPFEPVRKRLRKHSGRIRERKVDYLLYAITDLVIDHGFPLLDDIGDELEALEDDLLERPEDVSTGTIHSLRRRLLLLRRSLWPHQDAVGYMLHDEHPLIQDETAVYFRDCHDHAVRIIEILDNYRDMTANLLDVQLASSSHRLNETMRVLTVIATIFIPLTFITGIYGMNFSNPDSPWAMPELGWYYGYPLVLLAMIVVVAGMFIYFKRNKWL